MIRKPLGYYRLFSDVIPRLELAWGDLVRIRDILLDPGQIVWTENGPEGSYSLLGWRNHFAGELQRLNAYAAKAPPRLTTEFPDVAAMYVDYRDAMPRVGNALAQIVALHAEGATEAIPQGERDALAQAIDAELES